MVKHYYIRQYPESSNINEVIKTSLNLLLFFLRKDFTRTKKHQKAPKRNQAKVQNANKPTKIKNALKKHLSGKK